MKIAVPELQRSKVELSCDIARLVEVLPAVFLGWKPLRREKEHVALRQRQERRALPHVAEVRKLRLDLACQLPAVRLLLVEHGASLFRFRLCAEHEELPPILAEAAGITEMRRIPRRLVLDDDLILAGDLLFSLPRGESLRRRAHVILLAVAGVDETEDAVLDKARARIAAVLVVHIARPQCEHRQTVMHEIRRLYMAPALMFVLDAQGIPLEEDVVLSRVPGNPVGIVDEAERHFQMEVVVPAVRERESFAHLGIDRLFVERFIERRFRHDLTPSDRRACTSGRRRYRSR